MSVASSSVSSYAGGTSTTPLLGQTVDANLRATVARFGDREAVVDVAAGRRLTYTELDAEVDALARGLLARGVAAGSSRSRGVKPTLASSRAGR